MKVLLVGVSCVGKTTVGDLLARRLMCPSRDLDDEDTQIEVTFRERQRDAACWSSPAAVRVSALCVALRP